MKIWNELRNDARPKVRYWLPAAAMEEEDLRAELRALQARGFGGVELVVLAMFGDIGKSEDGWGTPHWDHMVDIAADETEKLGMSMDIAIGPGWPIASPVIESADDPAAIRELTYGEMTVTASYDGPLPERRKIRAEGTPHLVAAFAYEEVSDHVLRQDSYTDLLPAVQDGQIHFDPPTAGTWIIFAFYCQPAVHVINSGLTYVVDHHSKAGTEAVERYWDQVFADRKPYASLESFFCDSLEYDVAMDWMEELPVEFEKRRGYCILPYLPFLGIGGGYPAIDMPGYRLENPVVSDQINHDYVETLTQLYCENHLAALEEMAEKYGKTIRYQVAYNKMLEVERSGLYVAIPENEALGRPAVDGMKTMAAAAHLGRKKRYSFECAAEFGHSYGQNYEDLFWWVKRAAMAGMNAQVLHGASYSGAYHGVLSENGHLQGVTWPGYEGFGKFVSNYWNRTPSMEDAKGCLDAITRINTIFREQAKVDCLIFRDDYMSHGLGSEYCHYPDDGALSNHGYSYEFASEAVLDLPTCDVREGLLDPDGTAYKVLLVPPQEVMSVHMLERLAKLSTQGLPVFFIEKKPAGKKYFAEDEKAWNAALDGCADIPVIPDYAQVPAFLQEHGILPRIRLEAKKDMMTSVHEAADEAWYILYANNRVICDPEHPNPDEPAVSGLYKKGTTKRTYERPGLPSRQQIHVVLEGNGRVLRMDPFSGTSTVLPFTALDETHVQGTIEIEEDEMVILDVEKGLETGKIRTYTRQAEIPVQWKSIALSSFEPDSPEEVSFLRSHFEPYGEPRQIETLPDWPEDFAGRALYKAEVMVEDFAPTDRFILELGDVEDTFRLTVNGTETPFPDQVMKRVDLTGLMRTGTNELAITVTSNLYNKVFQGGKMPRGEGALHRIPRRYGIHATEAKPVRVVVYRCE